jgi:hypothetical protein
MRDDGLSGRLSQLHAVLDERLGFRQLSDLVRMAGALSTPDLHLV